MPPASGGSANVPSSNVNKAIQSLALKYCSECKSSFDELSKIIQVQTNFFLLNGKILQIAVNFALLSRFVIKKKQNFCQCSNEAGQLNEKTYINSYIYRISN